MYVSTQTALSLFASGRTTTIVRDSCDGMSHSAPSLDSLHWPIQYFADPSFEFGYRNPTEYLMKIVTDGGSSNQGEVVLH